MHKRYVLIKSITVNGGAGQLILEKGLEFERDSIGNYLNEKHKLMLPPQAMQDMVNNGLAIIAIG